MAAKKKATVKNQPVVQKQVEARKDASSPVFGFLPDDTPPIGAMLSLGFQQFLTMFPDPVAAAHLRRSDGPVRDRQA